MNICLVDKNEGVHKNKACLSATEIAPVFHALVNPVGFSGHLMDLDFVVDHRVEFITGVVANVTLELLVVVSVSDVGPQLGLGGKVGFAVSAVPQDSALDHTHELESHGVDSVDGLPFFQSVDSKLGPRHSIVDLGLDSLL